MNSDNGPAQEFAADQTEMAFHMPFMEELAKGCQRIVELGAGHGNGSTRAFVRGMAAGDPVVLVSVDHDPARPQLEPQVDWWVKVTGDTRDQDVVARVARVLDGVPPDLIYVDTVHTAEHLAQELPLWVQLAGPDTVWLFHDTWMFGQYNPMVEAIEAWCELHPEWQYAELTKESHGMGRMWQGTRPVRKLIWDGLRWG